MFLHTKPVKIDITLIVSISARPPVEKTRVKIFMTEVIL